MRRIAKLLVANRGEIALRVMRTARKMGIATVAVFSDADDGAPHVRFADEAVRIGPAPSIESYLRIDRILDAARRTGADAVHPGYGFLAENAAFAEACQEAGLVFVGPPPAAIRAMGSKQEARRLAAAAGVPVIPGYDGDDQSDAVFEKKAREIGFPVLLKASAGGGGKGMQIVRRPEDMREALEGARRVARSAFGDDTLLLERYIEKPRHVEIQILGDEHGNLLHLYERECSIQRRHQKIIEETPSVALDPDLRAEMGRAAVAAGKAVGYTNAGTVEFVLGPDRRFYFLEVNTRLQVEHPVTECITGLDLVREQIRVARGEALGYAQADVRAQGAALECRLYAEDPARGFLPQSGVVVDWRVPEIEGLRVDAGVETGSEVTIHYDPMLAKVITHAPTREEAIGRMIRALEGLSVQGIRTNRELLLQVLRHPEYVAGNIDTHFIENRLSGELHTEPAPEDVAFAALVAALAGHERRRAARTILPHLEPGYRNNRFCDEWVELAAGETTVRVEYRNLGRRRFHVRTDGGEPRVVRICALSADDLTVEDEAGHRRRARVVAAGDRWFVHAGGAQVELVEKPRFPDRRAKEVAGGLTAPMPGKVTRVLVEAGQKVAAGATLLILEAMKMEHPVTAPHEGTVAEVKVTEGAQVHGGALLVVVENSDT